MSEDQDKTDVSIKDLTDAESIGEGGDSAAEATEMEDKEGIKREDEDTKACSRPSGSGVVDLELDEKEYSDEEFTRMLDLYDETMKNIEEGEIVTGTVLAVGESDVVVDIGFKSEGSIPISEFGDSPDVKIGDKVDVYLEDVEDQEGQIVLSKQKADFMKVWDKIKEAHDNTTTLEGELVRRIRGGIVVDILGVEAFLPGSQIDIKQVKNFDQFIGQTFPLKIIKLNKTRRNIVVSRRAVLEEERDRQRQRILEEIEEGQVREGVVKNITDFGAFIDLGGVDGLLHITDMSWGRVSHPSELVAVGDRINVKVLSYDREKERISLGMKQFTPHPWENVEEKYPVGSKVRGKVVSITNYGAFVELEEGVEGLIHISEMSWTQRIRHPSRIVAIGDVVDAIVLRVNRAEEKISLGLKQVEPDPWLTLDERYPPGTKITGRVRNLTNFGAFVELEEGIDGLVHISDMSWTRRVRHPSEVMKKGQKVDAVVLEVDKGRRRVSLGYKQMFENPWSDLALRYAVGTETKGVILRLLDRGVVVELEGDVEGFVPASQLGVPGLKKPEDSFEVGDGIPMKVIEFDEEQRRIVLSVREYLRGKEREEIEEYRRSHQPKPVTIQDVVGAPEVGAISEEADVAERDEVEATTPDEAVETVESKGVGAEAPQEEIEPDVPETEDDTAAAEEESSTSQVEADD